MKVPEYTPKEAGVPLVYYQSERYAIEHGEALTCSESMRLNSLCLEEIEDVIRNFGEGDMIPGPGAYKPLVRKYGADRVAFALYGTIGSNIVSDQYSPENKEWAVGLFAPYFFANDKFPTSYQQYKTLNRDPGLVDHFVTGFRRTESEELEKLAWHHERGEAYPKICEHSFDSDMPSSRQWEWLWSWKQSADCARQLDYLSDSVMSEAGVKRRLVSILDEYGPQRTFSVLSLAASLSPKGSITNANMKWAYGSRGHFSAEEFSFLQAECAGLFRDSKELNRIIDAARPIEESLKDIDRKFEPAYLFGTPVLYSEAKIHDYEIPDHFYCYELRGSDYDPAIPVTVEENVRVNFAGSVLSKVEIPVPKDGFLRLGEDGILFDDPRISASSFINTMLSIGGNTLEKEMGENIRLENEKLILQEGPNDLGISAVNDLYGVYRCENPGCSFYHKNMDEINRQGAAVSGKDYSLIYFADMPNSSMSAEDIYRSLNEGISRNYIHLDNSSVTGREPVPGRPDSHVGSSDVIVINREGDVRAFYTSVYPADDKEGGRADAAEFTELPEFAFERRLLTGYTQTHIIEPTIPVSKDVETGRSR